MEQDAALAAEIARQQDLGLGQVQREQRPAADPAEPDSAAAVIGRVDILLARGVVELARAAAHEHVAGPEFAVVDLGTRDLQLRDRGDRRDVLDEVIGQPLGRDAVHRRDAHSVAVGVRQVLVDPDARGERRGVELARRQRHLPQVAVQPIAVVVHVHEIVVGADLLQL